MAPSVVHVLLFACVMALSGLHTAAAPKNQPPPKWDSSLLLEHIAWGETFDNFSHLEERLGGLFLRPDRVFKLVVLGNTSRVDLASTCNRIFGRSHFFNQTILDAASSPFGLFYLPDALSHEASAVVIACTSIVPPRNNHTISSVGHEDASERPSASLPKLDVGHISNIFFELLPWSPTATIYCMPLVHDAVTDVRVIGYEDVSVAQQLYDLFPEVFHALTFLFHVVLTDDDDEVTAGNALYNNALELVRLEAHVVEQLRRLLPRGDLLSHFLYINGTNNTAIPSLPAPLPEQPISVSPEAQRSTALEVQDNVPAYFWKHPHKELLSIVLALHAAAAPLELPTDLPSMIALGGAAWEQEREENRAREYAFVMNDLYQRYHCSSASGGSALTAEELTLQLSYARMRTRTGALYDKLRGVRRLQDSSPDDAEN